MMKLKDLIEKYDFPGSVVLLEGKRLVLKEDIPKLKKLGKLLTQKTRFVIFRGGNAKGADFHFSEGVACVDHMRLQVITPYIGHRQKVNKAYSTISLDEVDLAIEPEVVYQTKNKNNEKLVEQFVSGKRDRNSIKAAYLLRDTVKVLGAKDLPPATFAIFYDDLENPENGGTGHTIEVCRENNTPFINQSVWFEWL